MRYNKEEIDTEVNVLAETAEKEIVDEDKAWLLVFGKKVLKKEAGEAGKMLLKVLQRQKKIKKHYIRLNKN